VVTLYQNQQRLAKSYDGLAEASDSLDEQFAVLSRITIQQLNRLTDDINGGRKEGDGIPLVTREKVTASFAEWREFKKRPDFRDHNTAWFMGEDLTKLPPPTAKEEPLVERDDQGRVTKINATPNALPTNQEGAEVFGGDYGKSIDRDAAGVEAGPQGATADASNQVSEVRKPDAAQG